MKIEPTFGFIKRCYLNQNLDKGIVYPISNNGISGRLVVSWGWRSSQGFGCSPIKTARELGSERRKTVETMKHFSLTTSCLSQSTSENREIITFCQNVWRILGYKSGYMLENLVKWQPTSI